MSLLDEKIEEIINKTGKLIEQNAQYRRVVQDLTSRVKQLDNENKELRLQLEESKTNNSNLPVDKESLRKQIDKYIQDIDLSIQWLSDLE
jgi:predicted RNase H-like nuclease (RuvC/YqgF family)